MLWLVISDLHGDWRPLWEMLEALQPEVVLCCGDWGDPGQVSPADFQRLLAQAHVWTVYGNHDDLNLLRSLWNLDGTPVLLPQGKRTRLGEVEGLGISGIWAKSHRLPWYITDEEVASWVSQAGDAPLPLLITHACPVGVADLTPSERHGGQKCFLEAFRRLQPQVYLCGHLHRQQFHRTRAGQWVINVGFSQEGDYVLLRSEGSSLSVEHIGRWP